MDSQNDRVEAFSPSGLGTDLHVTVLTGDGLHRTVEANAIGKRLDQLFHILSGTPLDHQPLRLVADLQKSMVVEELHEVAGGKLPKPERIGRPDRSAHGQDELLDEQGGVFLSFQVVGQGHLGRQRASSSFNASFRNRKMSRTMR